jgi:hypothetical protein
MGLVYPSGRPASRPLPGMPERGGGVYENPPRYSLFPSMSHDDSFIINSVCFGQLVVWAPLSQSVAEKPRPGQ